METQQAPSIPLHSTHDRAPPDPNLRHRQQDPGTYAELLQEQLYNNQHDKWSSIDLLVFMLLRGHIYQDPNSRRSSSLDDGRHFTVAEYHDAMQVVRHIDDHTPPHDTYPSRAASTQTHGGTLSDDSWKDFLLGLYTAQFTAAPLDELTHYFRDFLAEHHLHKFHRFRLVPPTALALHPCPLLNTAGNELLQALPWLLRHDSGLLSYRNIQAQMERALRRHPLPTPDNPSQPRDSP